MARAAIANVAATPGNKPAATCMYGRVTLAVSVGPGWSKVFSTSAFRIAAHASGVENLCRKQALDRNPAFEQVLVMRILDESLQICIICLQPDRPRVLAEQFLLFLEIMTAP